MKNLKILLTAAIAIAMLAVPAGALAKRGDRDHDGMPDKWEKRHHLNVRANDARKDADKDGLRNATEYRQHTDPQDADSDNDGLDDGDEIRQGDSPRDSDSDDDGVKDGSETAGTVVSFENNVLTIQLPGDGAGTVSGTVSDSTEIECEDRAPTASASDDGEDRSGPSDSNGSDDDGAGHDATDDQGDDSDSQNDGAACTTANLVKGAVVHEAEMKLSSGGNVFTKIELLKAA